MFENDATKRAAPVRKRFLPPKRNRYLTGAVRTRLSLGGAGGLEGFGGVLLGGLLGGLLR